MYTQEQKDKLFRIIMDRIAVRCKTEEESFALSEILDNFKVCWSSGLSMIYHSVWDDYKEETTYVFDCTRNGIMYSPQRWYKENGYTVVDFNEIIISEPQSAVSLMEYMSL